ncbi:glyoxalase, putative [Eimeria necatrix]|uniref:Glyoxalase, putative n=1 Tax=Eimeria necatrix TaxID=51315 RepID=U6MRL7_9EIME|nr:glyoxalase, putative [Eimeria necatrix]CDJ64305.1 glyoxalase, putative [Eimeria necatrix]
MGSLLHSAMTSCCLCFWGPPRLLPTHRTAAAAAATAATAAVLIVLAFLSSTSQAFVLPHLQANFSSQSYSSNDSAAAAATAAAAAAAAAAATSSPAAILLPHSPIPLRIAPKPIAHAQGAAATRAAAASAAAAASEAASTAAEAPEAAAAAAALPAAAAAHREPLGASRLLHVRLLTLNLEKMVHFYTQLLGMKVLGLWGPPGGPPEGPPGGPPEGPPGGPPEGAPPALQQQSPHLWEPLSGRVSLAGGSSIPVDRIVLLGYGPEAAAATAAGGPPEGPPEASAGGPPQGPKLELIYSSRWAQQQREAEAAAAAALRKEESDLVAAVAAFQQQEALRQTGQCSSSSSRSSSSLLPSLSRMRGYERRRGRYDRGHHGFFGLSFLLPSLQQLQQQQVQQAGGKLLHFPAKRKQVPSMVPDQDARQEIWGQSCFMLDPDGNGVEVLQLTSSSSCSSIGLSEQARKQEAAINTWQNYMAEQEADISRQKEKQQLLQQLDEVEKLLLQLEQQQQQHQEEQQKEQQQQERDRLTKRQQELQRKLAVFNEQQRILDELEQQQQQRQREREAAAAGTALQHKGPLSPRLQKIRLYTSSPVAADRFFGSMLQMQLLRYKSHLLERLHPWTRFAATSRTYACEAAALRAKAGASEGAKAAAAAVAAAIAAAGDQGLYGETSTVPTEWEGPAAQDPPAAAAEVFRTEAAEREVPQVQVAYAYDENVVSVHPGFLHVALSVADVPSAVAHISSKEAEAAAAAEAEEKAAEAAATAGSKCQPCKMEGLQEGTHFGATEIVGDAEDVYKPTTIKFQTPQECLLLNFDGYPFLLATEEQAQAYYRCLQKAPVTGSPFKAL